MMDRQRILFFAAVGAVAVGIFYILFFKMMIVPARNNRQAAEVVRRDIDEVELALQRGEGFRETLRKWASVSFATDDAAASELVRAHLVQLLTRARLNNSSVILTPVTGQKLAGAKEIGWVVRTRGPVAQVTDLLYLLQSDPKLHKIDGVSWSPVSRSTDVDLGLRYTTLVMEPLPGDKVVPIKEEDKKTPEPDRLIEPGRRPYNLIAQRDLFRPYIARPPVPPQAVAQQAVPVNRQTQLKVVGLPTWEGKPAVVVRDIQGNTTQTYQVGQELAGGKIEMVDYRPMPDPRKPFLMSGSRVIVRIGKEHWAVEIGQSLSEKRKLSEGQVPEGLRTQVEQAAPAAGGPHAKPAEVSQVSAVKPQTEIDGTKSGKPGAAAGTAGRDNAVTQETSHVP